MSDPTPSQALLLFGLLARHGECPQAELMPAVKKADREALVGLKLVDVQKMGRGFNLKLSDAGWAWVASHLSAQLPAPQQGLSDLLKRLGEHLAHSGETLADFIGGKPEAIKTTPTPKTANKASAARAKKAPSSKARSSAAISKPARPPSSAALRKRVEAAYLSITGHRKDQSVNLSRLRAALPDLDRAAVDGVLARILRGDKKASLMRHDDPRQLDQADRDAAFNPAGDPFHVIWISS